MDSNNSRHKQRFSKSSTVLSHTWLYVEDAVANRQNVGPAGRSSAGSFLFSDAIRLKWSSYIKDSSHCSQKHMNQSGKKPLQFLFSAHSLSWGQLPIHYPQSNMCPFFRAETQKKGGDEQTQQENMKIPGVKYKYSKEEFIINFK